MTRRALLAAIAGGVVDPERLLWRPGAKLISIPAPLFSVRVSYGLGGYFVHADVFQGVRVPQDLCYLPPGRGFCEHGVSLERALDLTRRATSTDELLRNSPMRSFARELWWGMNDREMSDPEIPVFRAHRDVEEGRTTFLFRKGR